MRRAILILLLLASTARADEVAEKDHARELAREGAELFKNGNRREAIAKFEEAYAFFPSPVLLYNLGKAYAGVSDDAKAHRTLTRFLRETAAATDLDLDESRRLEVEDLIAELETRVAVVTITAAKFAGATIELDGEAFGVAPLADPVALEPGVHELTARRGEALVARKRVTVSAGTTAAVALVRIEDDLEKIFLTREVDSRPVYKKWWFWTAVGAAAVSTAAVILIAAPREVNDVEEPALGRWGLDDFD